MWSYTLRRTLGSVPTLLALCVITFFMMRVAPGGPFSGNRRVSPEFVKLMEDAYHLNDPLWQQFWTWFNGVLHFDLGPSLKLRDYNVSELIAIGLPTSLEVGAWAMLLSTLVGVVLGIAGALRRNGPIDYSAGAIAMVGVAVPIFVIGPLLQIVFGLQLRWLPVARWDDSWQCRVLPVLTLALPNIAYVSRLMRSSMIETARTNYVRTARAKGIGEWRTILKHALRGAIMPVVAYLGPATAVTISGSVVVETVFSIPGIGRFFVESVANRDYPLIMGVTLLYGAIVIAANLVTDIARGLLDPKVSYE
ncbi:ABC transporter permease [Dongia sedimenti]|uniref:ABC transporter permease n=1 Tax=Dongia sedimenti TaxID=3064282 RepID=A0ABU0YIW0_9PROT|nr:ABC transporter permease [Rhodospirillaceae bacterium R-7]